MRNREGILESLEAKIGLDNWEPLKWAFVLAFLLDSMHAKLTQDYCTSTWNAWTSQAEFAAATPCCLFKLESSRLLWK